MDQLRPDALGANMKTSGEEPQQHFFARILYFWLHNFRNRVLFLRKQATLAQTQSGASCIIISMAGIQ